MIICGALSLLAAPLVAPRLPLLLFGWVVHGAANSVLWYLNGLIFLVAGLGILFLRRWSYALAVGFHVFWIVASAIGVFTPGYAAYEREIAANLEIPGGFNATAFLTSASPWASAAWIVVPGGLLIYGLIHYRREFLHACAAAGR